MQVLVSVVFLQSIVVTDFVFQFEVAAYVDVHANDISVWYQFPQYIIITAGEVLFSVTGLSFAYTQVIKIVTLSSVEQSCSHNGCPQAVAACQPLCFTAVIYLFLFFAA